MTEPAPTTHAALQPYREDAAAILREVQDRPITTVEENAACGALLLNIKAKLKVVEQEADKVLAPQRAALEAARALFKNVSAQYTEAEALLKKRMGEFHDKQKVEEAKALEAALAQDDQTALVALAHKAAPVVQGISMREKMEFFIEDEAAVPADLKTTDPKKVRAAIKLLGDKQAKIPGIRIIYSSAPAVTVSRGG